MTSQTQNLLSEVNKKLKEKPLIYFCREVERAIGLELLLENYFICCIEDSDMVHEIRNKGVPVFCLEEEGFSLLHKSTGTLIDHEETQRWIKSVSNGNGFYALTFVPQNTIKFKIEKLGGTLLANAYELHQNFEDKLSLAQILESKPIRTPKQKAHFIHEINYQDLIKDFGEQIVVQTNRAHTGSGTFIIKSDKEFNKIKETQSGNQVKISQFIDGMPCTLNVCIFNKQIFIGGLQYQITGIPELANSSGATVGNDFGFMYNLGISDALLVDLTKEISKVSNLMIEQNYRGLFGIDLIIQNEEAYLIEINARQTANIPFQTQLELNNSEQVPLLLMHMAEFLEIETEIQYEHLANLKGSQIFLRSKGDSIVKNALQSGIYKLQSDNSAMSWDKNDPEVKEGVIFIDEEGDKPLILQKKGYRLEDIADSGFLIHFQKQGNHKRDLDELCRIQFKEGIIDANGQVAPWIIEALKEIEWQIL